MSRKKQLGRLGENALVNWCDQELITCNKPLIDECGWDFLLEFPISWDYTKPLDRSGMPLKCFIQVKATDSKDPNKRHKPIKLTNWKHLIEATIPAFFLILEFDGTHQAQRAYLVHVGEDYTEKYLKKMRQIPSSKASRLHKKKMIVRWGEEDRLTELNGTSLREKILTYVGTDPASYTKTKLDLVKSVGYGDKPYSLNANIKIPQGYTPQEYLTDFELGLVPQAQVSSFLLSHNRFDIPETKLQVSSKNHSNLRMYISDLTPVSKVWLHVTSDASFNSAVFPMDVYKPQQFVKGFHKIRMSHNFIEFVCNFDTGKNQLNYSDPEWGEIYSLRELHEFAKHCVIYSEAFSSGETIDFSFRSEDGKQVFTGKIALPENVFKIYLELAETIKQLWVVTSEFGIQDEIHLTLSEISQRKKQIEIMATLLQKEFIFGFSYPTDEKFSHSLVSIPVIKCLQIGEYRLMLGKVISGFTKNAEQIEDGVFRMCKTHCEIKQSILLASNSDPNVEGQNLAQKLVRHASQKGIVIYDESYAKLLPDTETEK